MVSNIDYIYISDVSIFTDHNIKLCVAINNEKYDHLIIICDQDNNMCRFSYDANTKLCSGIMFSKYTITINYNWESASYVDHNVPYANCKIQLMDNIQSSIINCQNSIDALKQSTESGINNIYNCFNIKQAPNIDLDETILKGCYISEAGKNINFGNNLFNVYQYKVTSGTKYILNGYTKLAANPYCIATFSTDTGGNKNIEILIAPKEDSTTLQYYEVLYIPSQDGYINTAEYNAGNHIKVSTVKIIPDMLYKLTNASSDILKIQVFGDSISDEMWRKDKTTWATLLPNYIPQRNIILNNSAVGGAGIGHGYANNGSGARFPEKTDGNYVYDLMTDGTLDTTSDIIIMFVGTNNWASGSALGQWGDSTVSTFYGATKLIAEHITKNTKSLFLVCTPCGRYNITDKTRETNTDGEPINNQNKTLRDYCDALIKTCNFYGIPVIDLNYELGWNRNNISNFCDDGLHPTAGAASKISQLIAGEIKKHLGI